LKKNEYILKKEFTEKCTQGIVLPESTNEYQDIVNEIYTLSEDVWKDVWASAATSAAVGGVMGGLTTTVKVMNNQNPTSVQCKRVQSKKKKTL
jgi:hypothetical protein